jgi:MOSC domain-containing protein YiiM
MQVRQLTLARSKGDCEHVDTLILVRDGGVSGDCHSAKDGSVSLLSGEAEQEIRTAGGLCAGRFSANIITIGVDYAKLRVGALLQINHCTLEITRVGKPCFAACSLVQHRSACPLPQNCAFACVVSGGTVHPADPIEVMQP